MEFVLKNVLADHLNWPLEIIITAIEGLQAGLHMVLEAKTFDF